MTPSRVLTKAVIAVLLIVGAVAHLAQADRVVSDFNTKYFLTTFKKFRVKYVWKADNPCEWSGVLCTDAQDSATLGLPGDKAKLSGTLPTFGKDTAFDPAQVLITAIFLNGNTGLKGEFPAHWYQLKNLEYIGLANTGLEGPIPESWQLLPAIISIDLSNTKACMNLPTWTRTTAGDMPRLSILNLSGDSWMRGTIPASWSTFTGARLDFTNTEFCGCAPPSVADNPYVRNQILPTNPLLFSEDCATANPCGPGQSKCGARTLVSAAGGPAMTVTATLVAAIIACVVALGF